MYLKYPRKLAICFNHVNESPLLLMFFKEDIANKKNNKLKSTRF